MTDEATWDRLQQSIEDALTLTGPDDGAIRELIDSDAIEVGDDAEALLEAWKIDGIRTAEWAMRKIRQARAHLDEATTLAEEEIAAIVAWRDRQTTRAVHDLEFFERKIGAFHAELLETEPRRKTLELPAGTSKITAGQLSVDVYDEAAAVEAFEEMLDNPADAVKYEAKVRKAEAKKWAVHKAGKEPGAYPMYDPATGEELPGVRIVRGEPSHKVTPAEVD